MTYHSGYNLVKPLILLAAVWALVVLTDPAFVIPAVLISIFAVVAMFLHQHVKIKNNTMTCYTYLLKKRIFTRVVYPKNVTGIFLKNAPGGKVLPLIKRKNLSTIRLRRFKDTGLYRDVEKFAVDHDLPLEQDTSYTKWKESEQNK